MSSETNDELSKETVFQIMGSYYGNAHYRAAQRLRWTTHDLVLTKQILMPWVIISAIWADCLTTRIPDLFRSYSVITENLRIEASMRS